MSKYEFEIDPQDNSTHAKIISLIGRDKNVLDVGCASGYISAVLKETRGCTVSGIELDPEDAKKAEEHCEKVVVGNVEDLDLSKHFKKNQFDVAVFADVLEHLVDPKAALQKILPFCKEGVVVSLPNVSHASVLYELLGGDFRYRKLGLLDDTHLRFFTKKTAIDMLEECGLSVESILKTRIPAQETELETDTSKFPEEVQKYIDSLDESDAYQYIIKANKAALGVTREPGESDFSPTYLEGRIAELEVQVNALKAAVDHKDETIAWYNNTLKEQLTSHYAHKNTYDELCIIKNEHDKLQKTLVTLQADRDRCVAHADRLQKFSPEALPKILGVPLKALIMMWTSGPFAPARVFSKKKTILALPEPRAIDDAPRVDLVTLLYNSEQFLDKYFESISKIKYPAEKLRIHLLNNASPDKSLEIVKEKYLDNPKIPFEIIVHESNKNTGFAGGNNIVLKKLLADKKSQFALLLNHDTEIDPDCINQLVQTSISDSSLGMVEAKQTPKEHPKYFDKKTGETSWCSGGCVLVSIPALRKTGLFDERFFLYVEDVDLSWRMWLNGYRCKINPNALCTHYTESLNEEKDFSLQQYFSIRNTFYMRYKFGTREEINEFNKLFEEAYAAQPDDLARNNLLKAKKDAKANMKKFLVDRWKLSTKQRPHWIKFDAFGFGKTRAFEDTEDGRRIIYDEVA